MSGDCKAELVERARLRGAGLVARTCPTCRASYRTPAATEDRGVEDLCARCRATVAARLAAVPRNPRREARGVRAVEQAQRRTATRDANGRHL